MFDLDVDTPEQIAPILREAAEQFRDAGQTLGSAWGDRDAGKVWFALADILEKAAEKCEVAVDRYTG